MNFKRREMKILDYMSNAKYNELKYFCMQYEDKKKAPLWQNDVELIEQTAIKADARLYQYILKNVSEGTAYEYMNPPCGRKQFYEARAAFFVLLSKQR